MDDSISRQAAIGTLNLGAEYLRRVLDDVDIVGVERAKYEWGLGLIESYISDMKELPSVQSEPITVNIDHELTQEEYEKLRKDMANAPIMLLPSEQPEQKNGKWVYNSPVTMKCDQCGFVIKDWDWHRFKFCPNCNADMRERGTG